MRTSLPTWDRHPAFGESARRAGRSEYLCNLGALDEADPKNPTGVTPNRMTRRTNDAESSGFYSIRRFDEGESLHRHLERGLAVPVALSTSAILVLSVRQSPRSPRQ